MSNVTRRTTISALGLVGLDLLLGRPRTASAKQTAPAIAALIEQAKKEGQLNITWTSMGFNKGAQRFEKGFNEYYGLTHRFNYTPGPSFAAATRKLAEELAAGKPAFRDLSLIAGSEQLNFELANQTSIPIDWAPLVPHIPEDLVRNELASPDGRLITYVSQAPTIMYNTNVIKPADAPKTFRDLLNPKWKGMIATTPYAANFEDLISHPLWEGEKAYSFIRSFSEQLSGAIRCAELERIASGEFPIFALTCEPGLVQQMKEKGAPVDHNVPRDWMTIWPWFFGVPRNAVNPASATLFIAWIMTPEGQAVLWENEGADLHYLPGSRNRAVFSAVEKEAGRKMYVATLRLQRTYSNSKFKSWVLDEFRAHTKK